MSTVLEGRPVEASDSSQPRVLEPQLRPEAVRPAVPAARRGGGGRVGLTPAAVLREAARLADELEDARVPLAAVADRLGVRLPSLYKHVAGVDGLRRGLARLAAEGLRDALDAAPAGPDAGPDAEPDAEPDVEPDAVPDPRTHLIALATAYRAWAADRPGLYRALAVRPHPDDAEHAAALAAVTDRFLDLAARYGWSGEADLVDGVRVLRSALHGFVSLELGAGLAGPDGLDRTFARLLDVLDAGLRPPDSRPLHAVTSASGTFDGPDSLVTGQGPGRGPADDTLSPVPGAARPDRARGTSRRVSPPR